MSKYTQQGGGGEVRGHWTLTLQTVMLHSGGRRLRTSMNNQEYIPVRLSSIGNNTETSSAESTFKLKRFLLAACLVCEVKTLDLRSWLIMSFTIFQLPTIQLRPHTHPFARLPMRMNKIITKEKMLRWFIKFSQPNF